MVDSKPLRCQKCGRLIGYISVAAKSCLEKRPDFDNVNIMGTCPECTGGSGLYQRNF